MEQKNCWNCEYHYRKNLIGGCHCTRFPSWIFISEPDSHWCGEYKEEQND